MIIAHSAISVQNYIFPSKRANFWLKNVPFSPILGDKGAKKQKNHINICECRKIFVPLHPQNEKTSRSGAVGSSPGS
jgi:hypothetical protein